jgi:FMNH2-dependent dimethyl sulfone monooxygenase
MRFGYWLPVFGGWLRNVDDERMAATWSYVRTLAQQSERWGFDLTLIAELNLNDIKGTRAPSLDAWSTAASLAAVTSTLELMVAVRPTFHEPALLAKQAANIDHISDGRLTLNVVSSWWADEAKQYGVRFDQHDERYARTREWLTVVDGLWREPEFSFKGRFYDVQNTILEPKPSRQPWPTIYMGGESPAAKDLIAEMSDAYVMRRRSGSHPARGGWRLSERRERRCRYSSALPADLSARFARRGAAWWRASPGVGVGRRLRQLPKWISNTPRTAPVNKRTTRCRIAPRSG